MKRFIKVDSDVLIEAKYVAKLSDDGSDTTITVNWDTGTNGVDSFTVTGKAGNDYLEALIHEINYSKEVIIDAFKIA